MSSRIAMWGLAIGVIAILAGSCGGAEPPPAKEPAVPSLVTVAVLDYEASAPGNPDMGSQIGEVMTTRLSTEDSFELVERAKMGQVLREQHLTLSGLVDQEQAVKVGKLVGAKLLVFGKAFIMDGKLTFVTKVVGVETGLVKGTIRSVEQSKAMSDTIGLVSEDVAALIRKEGAKLLPADTKLEDPIAKIKVDLGDRPRAVVAVVIPEQHRAAPAPAPVRVIDPAVETELKHVLVECGFKVVDTGRNDLAEWAKTQMRGEKAPWPVALQDADVVVVGEALSEFAGRTGDLVTCAARAEINVIDRRTGEILAADRETQRAVDLGEAIAGKTALQKAGHRLAVNVARRLVQYKPPAAPKAAAQATDGRPAARTSSGALPSVLVLRAPRKAVPAAESAKAPAAAKADKEADHPAKTVKRTIFAAPFENETGQDQYDPAAAAMGDLVGVLLAEQPSIAVVERQRLETLTDEQARSLRGLVGEKYSIAAGKLLKADTALVGRLYMLDGKMTVSAQAVDIATDRVLAADQLSCRPEDLVESALQMARSMAKKMELPLSEIDPKTIDKSPAASLHFAKALGCYYAGNMDEAIMQFMRTLDLDPDYIEAHYWCGQAFQRLGEYGHAAIEWEEYLKRHPDARHAEAATKLLAEAKAKDVRSSSERLAPEPAATPTQGTVPASGAASTPTAPRR